MTPSLRVAWGRCLRAGLPSARRQQRPGACLVDAGETRWLALDSCGAREYSQLSNNGNRVTGPRHYPSLSQTLRNTRGRELLRIVDAAVPNLKTTREFGVILRALAVDGQWRRSLRLLKEMRDIDLVPDIEAYNEVIAAMSKDKQVSKALGMLTEMREMGVDPDMESYNHCLGACKPSEWEHALHILEIDFPAASVEPDGMSFQHVAAACEEGKEWQRSLMLFLEIAKRGLDGTSVAHNYALSACRQGKQWRHGFEIMQEMERRGYHPDFRLKQDLEAQSRGLDRAPPPEPVSRTAPPDNVWQRKQQLRELREQDRRRQEERRIEEERKRQEQDKQEQTARLLGIQPVSTLTPPTPQSPQQQQPAPQHTQPSRARSTPSEDSQPSRTRSTPIAHAQPSPAASTPGAHVYSSPNKSTPSAHAQPSPDRSTPSAHAQPSPGRSAPSTQASYKQAQSVSEQSGGPQTQVKNPKPMRTQRSEEAKAEIQWEVKREGKWEESKPIPEPLREKVLGAPAQNAQATVSQQQREKEEQREPRGSQQREDARDDSREARRRDRPRPDQDSRPRRNKPKLRNPGSYVLPVFAQHDRSNHAERQALIKVIARVQEACGAQTDEEFERECAEVTGTVRLYASHTPCISCMACFCQFQRLFPKVKLCVDFDDWRDTRRMVEMARREEEYKRKGKEPPSYYCPGLSDMSDEGEPESDEEAKAFAKSSAERISGGL